LFFGGESTDGDAAKKAPCYLPDLITSGRAEDPLFCERQHGTIKQHTRKAEMKNKDTAPATSKKDQGVSGWGGFILGEDVTLFSNTHKE
jgi:hypothetical protein